ncbi:hypothetical protein [Kitasatospora sp. NBC_01300]|uniref:hypothetical protein n=1 Tax=Kitasatospora sp. NBC_01300 TaxID=2903574 RepID=UPI00352C727E|nr:hypothetical protein OG556_08110 [Kitasatospora sp. NBC_01300]
MLPVVETEEQWDAIVRDEAVMRPGAETLCAELGLAGLPLERFAEGSVPVYAVGDAHVLKLFPGGPYVGSGGRQGALAAGEDATSTAGATC